jgi:hypothetical protein
MSRVHEPRWRLHLAKGARKAELRCVLVTAPQPPVLSADAHVHLAHWHRPSGDREASAAPASVPYTTCIPAAVQPPMTDASAAASRARIARRVGVRKRRERGIKAVRARRCITAAFQGLPLSRATAISK